MSTQQKAFADLHQWLKRSRWTSLILPLGLLAGVLLLVLLLLLQLNSRSSQEAFERQAESQLLEVAGLLSDQLEQELRTLKKLGELLVNEVTRQLQAPEPTSPLLPAALEPLLVDLVGSHDLLAQVALKTPEGELLSYPCLERRAAGEPGLDVHEYPFYLLADPIFNPDFEPLWIDTYKDPAGRGWMLTLSLPVVVEGELKAVVGLDITLDALVAWLMERSLPWKGYAQLMAVDGRLLAFPPAGEQHWQVTQRSAQDDSSQTHNIFQSPELNPELDPLKQDASGLLTLVLGGEALMLSWSTLSLNGWKLLLVTPQEAVFAARQQLLEEYRLLRWLGLFSLLLAVGLFWFFLLRRDQKTLNQVKRLWPPEQLLQDQPPTSAPLPTEDLLQQLPGPVLICQLDAQDRILSCNLAFERFARLSRQQLKGQKLAPLLEMEALPEGSWMDELELDNGGHKKRHWWMTLARKEDQSGFVFLIDLTRSNLTQQQLRNERERARQAARMKSEFTQVVIREANTLLSELARSTLQLGNPDQSKACREKIMAVQQLMDDLLDMSDEGEVLDEREQQNLSLNLATGLEEVKKALEPQLEQQKRRLLIEFEPSFPEQLKGDRRRLLRLVRHLLRQTLQLQGQGDLSLNLSWQAASSSLRLELLDRGSTQPDAERLRRFQVTTPLGNLYQPAASGLNLGPLLTRQLVQELKGQLDVSTRPEGGLLLTLELPLKATPSRQGPARILVVDDGPVNVMLASSVLEKSGYQVDVAGGGRRALEMGREKNYDLVLMDIFMPGMDGLETTRLWRQLEGANAKIPILAVTANAAQLETQALLDQGLDGFLAKPYRPAQLRELVSHWLKVSGVMQ